MIIIDGIPGAGKTKTMVGIAIKEFKKANTKKIRKDRLKKGYNKKTPFVDDEGFYHFIFSNFPILLDEKRNIFSQETSLYYFTFDYIFPVDSLHFIMEGQLAYDSMEYQRFPQLIANYLQLHRHQRVANIFIDSQSIARLPKNERIVTSEWWRIIDEIRIPFLPIAIKRFNSTYFVESDMGSALLEGEKKWEHNYKIIWNIKKIERSYDHLCMQALSEGAKMIPFRPFTSLKMTKEQIRRLHFRTDEEKRKLASRSLFDKAPPLKI